MDDEVLEDRISDDDLLMSLSSWNWEVPLPVDLNLVFSVSIDWNREDWSGVLEDILKRAPFRWPIVSRSDRLYLSISRHGWVPKLEIVDHFLLDIGEGNKLDYCSRVLRHSYHRLAGRFGYRWKPIAHYYPFQGASRRDRRENGFQNGRRAERRKNAVRMKSSSSILLGLCAHRATTTGFLHSALMTSRMKYRRRRRSRRRCCSFSINDRTTESAMHASQPNEEKRRVSSFQPTWTNTEKRVCRRATVCTFLPRF